MPAFVLDALSAQCAGKPSGGPVFPGRDGGYLPCLKSSGGWFSAVVKRAKVQTITPPELRQSCASLAVSAGVNVLALQRMLGHASAKVTLDTYADLFDDDLDAFAESLHSRYAPSARLGQTRQVCSKCAHGQISTTRWRTGNPSDLLKRHSGIGGGGGI